MILRPSQKLALKMKAGPLAELPMASDPMTDWSSHVFEFDRASYLLVCNTRSFYSVLLPGSGIRDAKTFLDRAMERVSQSMDQEGMGGAYRARIAPAISSVQFAKSLNRVVTGSMNDLIHMSKVSLEQGGALEQIELLLNRTPFSALRHPDGSAYGRPRSVLKQMADASDAADA